jgi:glycosidase
MPTSLPRKLSLFVLVLLLMLLLMLMTAPAWAQWATPVIDGVINPGEYGNNNTVGTNTGQNWYMTWDATNLYVGITNANLSEGAVIYIGPNPQSDPKCCSDSDGNLTGFTYDNTNFSSLPFRSKFVTYVKDGYREYRNSDGSGGWTGSTANYGQYASGSGNVREVAIPWSAINQGGGLPTHLVFFGYLTSIGGYVYGQVPNDNAGQFIGTSAAYTQYYNVSNTGDGTSTPPFSDEQPAGFTGDQKAAFKHDTFDPFYRTPSGAAPENAQVTLRFRSGHFDLDGVFVRAYLFDTASGQTTGPVDTAMAFDQNITENGKTYDVWKVALTMPSATTVYYYKFKPFHGSTVGFYSDDYLDDNDNVHKDGLGKAYDGEPFPSFQVTVYDPNFQTPAWLQNATIYHIMPDRFRNGDLTNDYCRPGSTTGCPFYYGSQQAFTYNQWNTQICDPRDPNSGCFGQYSNQFYGGDLKGVQNKLDYLQAIGIDTIYMNPIFQARSNHRYDTDNYLHVDPALGGDAAFASLQAELNRRGMHVILDGVFNHASSDGLYFDRYHRYDTDGACESLQSVWRSWFHFKTDHVPCDSNDYDGWFGFDSLPTFDHDNPAVRDFFYRGPDNVTQHWYGLGASGWRFDVADDGNFPHNWWHEYRTFAKGYKADGPLIGEIWPNGSQWLAGDQMDSNMNYRFRKNITGFVRAVDWSDDNNNGTNNIPGLTPSQFDHANRAVRDDYPPQATAAMMNLIDSHDVNRALFVMTEQGDNGLTQAKQRLKLAALFQFTYVGAPTVWYGDEVALNSPSKYSSPNGPVGDPYTRAPYPWRDQPGDPHIYGPPDMNMFGYYATLGHLRKLYRSLRQGDFTTLLVGDTQQPNSAPNTYAFARTMQGETPVVVALNNGTASNRASIPVNGIFADGTQLHDALSGDHYSVTAGAVQVRLAARTGVLLVPNGMRGNIAAPAASIRLGSSANGSGWSNTPLNLELSASGGDVGIAELRYWIDDGVVNVAQGESASLTLANEGAYSVGLRAIDNAGYVSQQATQVVQIDLHPPVVTVTGVRQGASYPMGRVPVAGCSTSDALSGVAANATLTVRGGSGHFTATCSGATDNAGNAAQPVSAAYSVLPSGSR